MGGRAMIEPKPTRGPAAESGSSSFPLPSSLLEEAGLLVYRRPKEACTLV